MRISLSIGGGALLSVVIGLACVALACVESGPEVSEELVLAAGMLNAPALTTKPQLEAPAPKRVFLSTSSDHWLGANRLSSRDGDVVEYDFDADEASTFLREAVFLRSNGREGAKEDIDAFDILPSGECVISTRTTAIIGRPALKFHAGDLVAYNPETQAARKIMDHRLFVGANGGRDARVNIDAVDVLPDGRIALSTARKARLPAEGGLLVFSAADVVLFDPTAGTVTLFLSGAIFRDREGRPAAANVDAFDLLADGSVLLSTKSAEFLGRDLVRTRRGDVVRYDPRADAASIYFHQSRFRRSDGRIGAVENIDAIHAPEGLLPVVSTKAAHRLGENILRSEDGDVVRYDPELDEAEPVLLEDLVFRGRDAALGVGGEIDAVHIAGDEVYFSTGGQGRVGANLLEVRKGDLVAYDPVRDRARLFLSQDNFRRRDGSRGGSANIDAVFVHTDGTLLLSTSAAARLGAPPHTLEMSKGDLVLYDPVADTARVVLGSEIYRTRGGEPGAVADIDAVHWLGGGRLLFSTFAAERVGANALLVKDGDVILYDSAADTAEVFMQERTFRRSNGDLGGAADIDGFSMGRR